MKKLLLRFLAVFTSLTLLFPYLAPVMAAEESTFDFGDAPDGGRTYYTATSTGSFPSKLSSNGARVGNTEEVWLGKKVDEETDSKQIDADKFDDGVGTELKASKTSKAYVFVHKAKATTGTAYINMFFDWNKDGKWEGNDGVADEWAVRNFPVDLDAQTRDVTAYIPEFTAGKKTENIWYRAIVTLDERLTIANQNGQGLFQKGEVEDYGPHQRPGKRYGIVCKPKLKVIKHGTSGTFKIVPKYKDTPDFTQSQFADNVQPQSKNGLSSSTKTRDIKIKKVLKRRVVIQYKSKKKDPPKRTVFSSFDVRVRFGPGGKEASVTATCNVAVVHDQLDGKAQATHDYTLTQFDGSFQTEIVDSMTQLATRFMPTGAVDSKSVYGFAMPLDEQHPKLPEPVGADLDVNGQGWQDWQCQLLPSDAKYLGSQWIKTCWGTMPLWFFAWTIFILYFNQALNFFGIHLHLLDQLGNVLGALDLPPAQ